MRVLNPKNGNILRMCKRHTNNKMTGVIRMDMVSAYNMSARKRVIYRREKTVEHGRAIVRQVPVRVLFKHPSN